MFTVIRLLNIKKVVFFICVIIQLLVKKYFSYIYFVAFKEEGKHEKANQKNNNFSKLFYIKYNI